MAVTKVIELVTQLDDKGLKELETGLKNGSLFKSC